MKKTARRFLSMLLVLSMVFSLLVFPAAATESEEPAAPVKATGNAAPAAKAAEDAPSAAETAEEPEEEAPVFTVTDSNFTFKLNADEIDVSGVSTSNVEVPEDAEIDENNREIIVVGEELKNITVLNEDGESVALTEEEIQTILYLYSQYQKVMADNANIYGVQTPFFLEFNDNKEDGLGILGEMLVLAGTSVDAVRNGDYSYDNLVGMIQNFTYTYALGARYYGEAILAAQKEALEVVNASGAKTEAQKLLVLNSWLAQNNTFDMPYIMNADSDKNGTIEDDEKLMEAPNGPQKPEHYDDVYNIVYQDYTDQLTKMFHDQIYDGVVAKLRQQFYENAIKNMVYQNAYNAGVEAAVKQDYIDKHFDEEYKAEKQRVYDEVYQEAYERYLAENCEHEPEAVFTWNGTPEDDFAGTTADIVCKKCNTTIKEDVPAEVTYIATESVASTCKVPGKDVYYAEVTVDDVSYKSEPKEVELPLAEHQYGADNKCTVCGAIKDDSEEPKEAQPEETESPVTDEEKAPSVNELSPEEKAAALAKAEAEKAVKDRDEEIRQTAKEKAEAAYDALSEEEKQELTDQFVDSNEEAVSQIKAQANTAAENFMTENADAIKEDAPGFVESNFSPEAAAQLAAACDNFIADAEENGIEVDPDNAPGYKMTVEELTQKTMENEPIVDVNGDNQPDLTANQAIPVFADQAAAGMTTGVINGWKGCHIGAFGFGTSVCLGYAKAYTYLIQCMHPEIYGISADADMTVSSNWKTADDLYVYDENGKLDVDSGYLVDTVRVTFDTEVSMFGPDNTSNFGEVHFWNAVKVDGKWYYIDPCYVDVYVEVMSRDRVETDGNMNHLYFMFSHTSAVNMYDGYTNTDFGSDGSGITSLYAETATHTDYEDSWMSRINCVPYFADGYAYYVYDSTDLLTIMEGSKNPSSFSDMDTDALYKLVRHKLTDTDAGDNGDTDYDTLITFNYENDDGELEARVYNPKTKDMVKNEWLTELVSRHLTYAEVYPAVEITSVLYGGKLYFNLNNCILSFDLETYEVALVKEYNTVYGVRDDNVDFGGKAFSITTKDKADFTVENHPIAALNLVGDELTVSIATNFALISGKKDRTNPAICIEVGTDEDGKPIYQENGYGYEYEESNYNPNYNTFFNSDEGEQYGYKKEVNDNDEFMWSANFVEKLSMAHLTGDSHTYKLVTVEAFCGTDGFTEERCTECGAIKADSRVYDEGTAHDHHFIRFDETYYTKDDGGSWNKGTCYVCPICGYAVSEPSEPGSYADEEEQAEYERKMAEYEAAAESAGHTYVPADAQWSEDGATVSFRKLVCSNICPTRKPYLDALLNDETITVTLAEEDEDPITVKGELQGYEGTCADGAVAVYVASGEVKGYAFTATNKVQLERGKHVFDDEGICEICGAGEIRRIYGKTRYETSFAIADELKDTLEVETFDTIIVANGANFPDALAGSYLAAQKNAPILLTQEMMDADVLAYVKENLSKGGKVYILGGTAAVSQAFEDGLKEAGITSERLSGKTRYDTGLKILKKAGLNGNEILVCTGESFADALSVSAANRPILLVKGTDIKLTAAQEEYLKTLEGDYTFYIIGGTAAVSADLETALEAYGNVERISGKGRYETSVAVAEKFFKNVKKVALAYAMDYPDGLCGGTLACKLGAPVLLVKPGQESAAAAYVAKNGIKQGVIFGGSGRITDDSVRTVFGLSEDAVIG